MKKIVLLLLFTISSFFANAQCWKEISAGWNNHTLAIQPDGSLWAWGANNSGSIGDGTTTLRNIPVQIGSATNWLKVDAGRNCSSAIKSDGTLWTWGVNSSGQLGDGTTTSKSSPTQIGTGTDWSICAIAESHTLAIKTDGTLWAWGFNGSGQLGNNSTTNATAPIQIGTETNWAKIDGGQNFSVAIKTDGTLWGWGVGTRNGSSSSNLVPTQIGSDTNWSKIATGSVHTIAIKTDGTLWTWGSNFTGQLGNNSTTANSTPTQVGVATNWLNIAGGTEYSVASTTAGTFWAWGRNVYRNLGDGTTINRLLPVQIGTETDWTKVSAGESHTIGLKNNRSRQVWGDNAVGQFGNGTAISSAVPVLVGTCVTPVAPTATSPQTFCGSATVTNLVANGNSIQWYSTASNGAALLQATAIVTGTTYFASQTVDGVESTTRTEIVVSITPNSDNVTTLSVCDTYTWANNNQVYTQSGTYTGTTTNCVTEKLNLTITPSSNNVTTLSVCDTYTWANNAQSYTQSGTYTGTTTNCVTEKLNLTITPSSNNVTTISVCDTYTWANNNQVYTQSGTYTGTTTNCVTEKLILTITTSSDNITTISVCDTYTWANNNQVYTQSGTYTGTTTNCVTEKLNLTITPSSSSPSASAYQFVSTGATIADLTAAGTDLKWYAAMTGGSPLATTTSLTGATAYYVSQNTTTCESNRTQVVANFTATGVALNFITSQGSQLKVNNTALLNPTAALTIECWVRRNNDTANYDMIVAKTSNDSAWSSGYGLYWGDQGNIGFFTSGWNSTYFTGNSTIPINTWTHVAATYDGTVRNIYINGVLDMSNTLQGTVGANNLDLFIGSNDYSSYFASCDIDLVRIWNTARTQSEIDANKSNCITQGTSDLIAQYDFEEQASSTAFQDTSGNNLHGTINNMVASNWIAGGTCGATLSVPTNTFNSTLNVYPNPSNSIFNIAIDADATINITDILGKQILIKTIQSGNSQLDLSDFENGIYLMRITNESNQTKTIKIIKN